MFLQPVQGADFTVSVHNVATRLCYGHLLAAEENPVLLATKSIGLKANGCYSAATLIASPVVDSPKRPSAAEPS